MDEKSRRRAKLGTILAGCLFVFFLSIRFIAPLFASALPASWLDEIGSELVTEVGKENGGFCNEEAGLDALKKMAQAIADESKTDIEFKVHVSNADVFNAFAAPGDYIVLYKPIIEEAESPNEVAGVLAHEMAHLVEKHPAEGVAEAIGYTLFSLINPVGDSFGSSLGKSLLTNAHSRSDELDADRVGVEMLNDAGIDSHGLIDFFERMDDMPKAISFLSTHPHGEDRTKQVDEIAEKGEDALDEEAWEALRNICDETGDEGRVTVEAD